ncbi:MAG: hypothetical protein IPF82_11395 [Blastocatellia bacterium]|nr:hypothetical protein [Blastocatellia bacterium]
MNIDDTNEKPDLQYAACAAEGRTLAWLEGRLESGEAREAERHVAECEVCRETTAMIAGFKSDSLDDREAELLEAVSERTAAAAIALGKASEPSRPATVVLGPRASSTAAGWFGLSPWMAVAAMLAIAAGALAVVWFGRGTSDRSLDRGERLLAEATTTARPTTLRVSGLAYAPARVTRGTEAENADRLEAARALLSAAVATDPSPRARHALGRVLIASGDAAGAVEQLSLASRARPKDVAIMSDLAVARSLARDVPGARADLDRALAIDPNCQEALFNRAALRARESDSVGAREDLERLHRIDPLSPWVSDAERLVEAANAPAR